MVQDRKRQAELAKLQQTSEKQQSVLKRKVEEVSSLHNYCYFHPEIYYTAVMSGTFVANDLLPAVVFLERNMLLQYYCLSHRSK
jgi:hypothetical protein